MRILITNDDGAFSEGIRLLALELHKEHDVMIVAPNTEKSGASHSLTFQVPLLAKKVRPHGIPEEIPVYAVAGSPADCAKLGLGNFMPDADIVVSGINHGGNMGADVFYSGTVGAATEAAFNGKPAIAVSLDSYRAKHMQSAAVAARRAVRYIIEHPMPKHHVLNVNVPDLPLEEIKGTCLARLCLQDQCGPYIERVDPFERPYYWVGADYLKLEPESKGTDRYCATEGYIVVTPLKVDRTAYDLMEQMEQNALDFLKD